MPGTLQGFFLWSRGGLGIRLSQRPLVDDLARPDFVDDVTVRGRTQLIDVFEPDFIRFFKYEALLH